MKLLKKIIFIYIFFNLIINQSLFTYGYCYDDYPEVYGAYWNNKTARWDSDNATRFELVLYRNGLIVTRKMTNERSINLSSYTTKSDSDYYFEVRPYNRYFGWGNWVSSDTIYVRKYYNDRYCDDYYYDDYYGDRYYYYDYYDNLYPNHYSFDISYAKNDGPTIIDNSKNVVIPNINQSIVKNSSNNILNNKKIMNVPTPQVLKQQINGLNYAGTFLETKGSWHFIYTNGAYAINVWVQLNNKWYYIDIEGLMAVGFYTINGDTYYFNSDGTMAIGNVIIDGYAHLFNYNGVMVY